MIDESSDDDQVDKDDSCRSEDADANVMVPPRGVTFVTSEPHPFSSIYTKNPNNIIQVRTRYASGYVVTEVSKDGECQTSAFQTEKSLREFLVELLCNVPVKTSGLPNLADFDKSTVEGFDTDILISKAMYYTSEEYSDWFLVCVVDATDIDGSILLYN
jgi:hypothetical protein